jgi:eukaryotic-like serine/threonine-protein kinase
MTPERWRKIKAVFQTALEREEDQRAAFLDQVCASDRTLRQEVDALLGAARESSGFLEVPPVSLWTGTYLLERLNTAFGGRYRLQRELGGGAMSRVYLAEEAASGRRVVVKVLSPGLVEDARLERFRREVRLTAGLRHPNIVRVLATGEVEGLLYYAMPFVEGESLKDRLGRERRLAPAAVVRILADVVGALAYAHDRGIMHRDVKPANILLENGRALVLDFGIARVFTPFTGETDAVRLTAAGTVIGTPAYMAPEQAAGDDAADHRADLYAVGVVAYEMLHGELPEQTEDPVEPAPSQSQLHELVAQLLKRRAADRPASPGEVLQRLERISRSCPEPLWRPAVPRPTLDP